MARVNLGKVLVGGLVAGVVINISEFVLNMMVVGDASRAAMERLGLPADPGSAGMTLYILMGFVLGILAVWLYAAIRPRYGPGPRTALLAGAAAWALFYGLCSIGFLASGMWPSGLIVIGLLWGFVELAVATTIGAKLYTEAESA